MANNLHKFPAFLADLLGVIAQGMASKVEARDKAVRQAQTAVLGFVQHTNPRKNQRRKAIKAVGGIRQFKKARRELRLAGQAVQF